MVKCGHFLRLERQIRSFIMVESEQDTCPTMLIIVLSSSILLFLARSTAMLVPRSATCSGDKSFIYFNMKFAFWCVRTMIYL